LPLYLFENKPLWPKTRENPEKLKFFNDSPACFRNYYTRAFFLSTSAIPTIIIAGGSAGFQSLDLARSPANVRGKIK